MCSGNSPAALATDLNQPLTAILSNAQAAHKWLLRDPPNTEYAAEILQDIIDDDRRAAAMIHRLRTLLKRGDLRVERIDVADLMAGSWTCHARNSRRGTSSRRRPSILQRLRSRETKHNCSRCC